MAFAIWRRRLRGGRASRPPPGPALPAWQPGTGHTAHHPVLWPSMGHGTAPGCHLVSRAELCGRRQPSQPSKGCWQGAVWRIRFGADALKSHEYEAAAQGGSNLSLVTVTGVTNTRTPGQGADGGQQSTSGCGHVAVPTPAPAVLWSPARLPSIWLGAICSVAPCPCLPYPGLHGDVMFGAAPPVTA